MVSEGFLQQSANVLFGRLAAGSDLIDGIAKLCIEHGVKYGAIASCMGSLSSTRYTYVYASPESPIGIAYHEPFISKKSAELLCAQGTVGIEENRLAVHLHAVLCDTDGTIFCGHMLPGSIVCATAEISILVASEGRIARSFDEQTQFSLFRYTT